MKQLTSSTSKTLLIGASSILIYLCIRIGKSLINKTLLLIVPPSNIGKYLILYNQVFLEVLISVCLVYLIVVVYRGKKLQWLEKFKPKFFIALTLTYLILITLEVLLSYYGFTGINELILYNPEWELWITYIDPVTTAFLYALESLINKVFLIVLLFVSLNKLKGKTTYDWPLNSKDEYVVNSSLDKSSEEKPPIPDQNIYNVLYLKDGESCSLIWGDTHEGHTVTAPIPTDQLPPELSEWTSRSILEHKSKGGLEVMTAISHFGQAGMISLKKIEDETILWTLQLTELRHLTSLNIDNQTIVAISGAIEFRIPIQAPETFKAAFLK